jgi:type VI secretion system protein VasG
MKAITDLKLRRIDKRLQSAHSVTFTFDDDVVERIAERCTEVDTGARNIDFIIDRQVLPEASRALIGRMAEERMPDSLTLGLADDGGFTYTFLDD